ncbi:MAG: FAD-dependent oxidoreductase [Candidatus Hydrogenedentes bacterium]|nr:FAD-dependent oxidoreductase [Candidatus Hydrogenedentota bacterium]
MKHLALFLLPLTLSAAAVATPVDRPVHQYDVVVYGATAGGVAAAVAAANEGRSVALIEPRHHVGGMTTGGLGATDFGRKQVIGGMARAFYEELGDHYGEEIAWYFEPHQGERVLRKWLREARVDCYFGSRLGGVERTGDRIDRVTLLNGWIFAAPVFIDCSYEGDFLPLAGISFTWGRESREQYGESLAGRIEYSPKHQFSVPVDPYDGEGNLLPLIHGGDAGVPGEADRKVQAYNFRLCMTQDPKNRVAWPMPDGYDPAEWELLRRYLAARPETTFAEICNPVHMPNGKTDTNNNGPISTDFIGGSWGYPNGTYAEQEAIVAEHERYVKGFFYFLANDPSVPAALQAETRSWGLAKDEFTDTNNWPHQLYVRESRRMIGAYVQRQSDLQENRHKDDSIGMASYNSDSHHVQRIPATESPLWPPGTPSTLNEGDMQVGVQPYDMSYFAFVPQKRECANLLVGSTFSASHVAYSSMRMEPQYMIIGQAIGTAASLAIEAGVAVQDIDIAALQEKLLAGGAILHQEDAMADFARPSDYPGVVVDSDTARVIGNWSMSSGVTPYLGFGYLHDGETGNPANRVIYTATLPAAGNYEVRVSYTANPNRATNALIRIHAADGVQEKRMNQREKAGEHAPFVSLGVFPFESESAVVEIVSTPDAGGYVIADAVQWLPVE